MGGLSWFVGREEVVGFILVCWKGRGAGFILVLLKGTRGGVYLDLLEGRRGGEHKLK